MHPYQRTLNIHIMFPDHAPRISSGEHRSVRKQLIVKEKRPCYICGRTMDDFMAHIQRKRPSLGKQSVRTQAIECLEIHHLYAEYSQYLNLDPELIAADHPIFADYNHGPYQAVDDIAGSLVLCALHHRGSDSPGRALEEGIHAADFATWLQQKYLKPEHLDQYIPGVIVTRKGISDEDGFLDGKLRSQ